MQAVLPLSALLLTSPGCAHCLALKRILKKLLDQGLLDQLEIVDLSERPAIVAQYAVRSVPWLKLGPIILSGAHSEAELREYISQLGQAQGIERYLRHLLAGNELNQVVALLHQNPAWFHDLLRLAADPELELKIRLGINALFEEFAGDAVLQNLCPELSRLAQNPDHRVRADAAYFFSLLHSEEARGYLRVMAADPHPDVREIAEDGLLDLP